MMPTGPLPGGLALSADGPILEGRVGGDDAGARRLREGGRFAHAEVPLAGQGTLHACSVYAPVASGTSHGIPRSGSPSSRMSGSMSPRWGTLPYWRRVRNLRFLEPQPETQQHVLTPTVRAEPLLPGVGPALLPLAQVPEPGRRPEPVRAPHDITLIGRTSSGPGRSTPLGISTTVLRARVAGHCPVSSISRRTAATSARSTSGSAASSLTRQPSSPAAFPRGTLLSVSSSSAPERRYVSRKDTR